MAYELNASVTLNVSVDEKADATTSPASGGTQGNARSFNAYALSLALHSASLPPISSRPIDFSRTLAAADEDVNLAAAPLAADITQTIDLTGKKLVVMILHCPTGNSASMKLHQSGANDYNFNGGEDLVIQPGEWVVKCLEGATGYVNPMPAVAAAARIIRITGTIGNELEALAVFG